MLALVKFMPQDKSQHWCSSTITLLHMQVYAPQKKSQSLQMTVLPHPLYSPDLTPKIITCLVLLQKRQHVAFSTANKKIGLLK
jgi:hypothetical protein